MGYRYPKCNPTEELFQVAYRRKEAAVFSECFRSGYQLFDSIQTLLNQAGIR
jgi:hypothetical protein